MITNTDLRSTSLEGEAKKNVSQVRLSTDSLFIMAQKVIK